MGRKIVGSGHWPHQRSVDGVPYTVDVVSDGMGRCIASCPVDGEEVVGEGRTPEAALAEWQARADAISDYGIRPVGLEPRYPAVEHEKASALIEGGFLYSFDRTIFVSHELKKVITKSEIDDFPLNVIQSFVRKGVAKAAIEVLPGGDPKMFAELPRRLGWHHEETRATLAKKAREALSEMKR
jgi:hypothetical protein